MHLQNVIDLLPLVWTGYVTYYMYCRKLQTKIIQFQRKIVVAWTFTIYLKNEVLGLGENSKMVKMCLVRNQIGSF